MVKFPSVSSSTLDQNTGIRPILKHRDDTLHGILKYRDKSSSPVLEPSQDQRNGEWSEPFYGSGRIDLASRDERFLEEARGGGVLHDEAWGRVEGLHDEGQGGFRSQSSKVSEPSRLFQSHSPTPKRLSPPSIRLEPKDGTPPRKHERWTGTSLYDNEDEILCIEETMLGNNDGKIGVIFCCC